MVLEKTLEDPVDCKEIKPVNLKGSIHFPWQEMSKKFVNYPLAVLMVYSRVYAKMPR